MANVTRKKYQLTRDKVRLQNQLESLLEEAHIKLSSLVTDLLGASARRMLKALADGETNPAALAALADERLRATSEQLCDALGACTELKPVYRRLLKMALEHLQFLERQTDQLDQQMANLLSQHQDAVQRLAEVPGFGVDSAHQIIAEVGPTAATFPSEKCLSSWVGACPGEEETGGVNYTLRRTWSRCQPEVQASAHGENDPTTAKARLSDRRTQSATLPSTSAVIFDPADSVLAAVTSASPITEPLSSVILPDTLAASLLPATQDRPAK